jgi:exo-1,4-beta-D-glucosaminidase
VTYPIGANFSKIEMSKDSPFAVAWWYRTEFDVPQEAKGKTVWLAFDGINNRANIWLNGRKVASATDVSGAYRRYEFEVSSQARPGERNALAVEVFAQRPEDLGINWVDWNPAPPDKDMGLWGGVFLETSGPVALRHPYVNTKLDLPSLETAHLTVGFEARNATSQAAKARLDGVIDGEIRFSREVELPPGEQRDLTFSPADTPQLDMKKPRLWWPYAMGRPELHSLRVQATVDGAVSDARTIEFGIEEVTSELVSKKCRLFKINGRPVLIRGGGWSQDMMLRQTKDRLEAELSYVRAMNLNTVRLEGKLETEEFFDLADRSGILVMAGWCCCDRWEEWKKWTSVTHAVSQASLKDQARRLRSHPSVLVWLNGSDNPPPSDVERDYLAVLKAADWQKPVLSSAQEKATEVTGESGVKMTGPYEYVPPSYWLADTRHGGAFGFNTETSPGPAVPPIESLKAMLPADHLWPIDAFWNFHAGGEQFKDIHVFTEALEARYGKAQDLLDYTRKAQALAYDGERAMFEAYGRNRYQSSGVIQWMLNNAWPSMIWHLYDNYLRPGGGYFGVKKACEPLHVQYSYDDRSVAVVNERPETVRVKVKAQVLDLSLEEQFSQEAALEVGPDQSLRAFSLPLGTGPDPTYFVRLELQDPEGKVVSRNFYWLSAKADVLLWDKSDWWGTPIKAHGDLQALSRLAPTEVKVASEMSEGGEEGLARVRVQNVGKALAFQVRLKLLDQPGGSEILPVYWDDNYLELLPGEEREISARYRLRDRKGSSPTVEIDGWNLAR